MTGAEAIKFTFTHRWKWSESVGHSHRKHLFAAACQNLMRIGLVADIPDEMIRWGIQ